MVLCTCVYRPEAHNNQITLEVESGHCELPDVGAGNGTEGLWESSMHCTPEPALT